MRVALFITLLSLGMTDTSAQSVNACPELPSKEYVWSYKEGPDFDLCYGKDLKSGADTFGVYLGNHPSFHEVKAASIGMGQVGGIAITWYAMDTKVGNPKLARQTLVPLRKPGTEIAHVWVFAENVEQLEVRLKTLKRIRFVQ